MTLNWFRVLLLGGLFSYRALFGWLSPAIFVPALLVAPICQMLLFAYIGRGAGLESDSFFVIGNALQFSAVPCLFAVTNTVVGERLEGTLGLLLASPAPRLALIVGRSLPIIANGVFVSMFALLVGATIFDVGLSASQLGPIAVAAASVTFSCTGLGLLNAAVALQFRDTAVLSNILFGILLLCSGANVPPAYLPGALSVLGQALPLTHGLTAARAVAAGGRPADVMPQLLTELGVGIAYGIAGAAVLRLIEIRSRRTAALDLV